MVPLCLGPPSLLFTDLCLADSQLTCALRCADAAHRWFAGNQIRNVSAIGGNIVTGSPISDLNPIWMATNTTFTALGQASGQRVVKASEFFLGYRWVLWLVWEAGGVTGVVWLVWVAGQLMGGWGCDWWAVAGVGGWWDGWQGVAEQLAGWLSADGFVAGCGCRVGWCVHLSEHVPAPPPAYPSLPATWAVLPACEPAGCKTSQTMFCSFASSTHSLTKLACFHIKAAA